MSLRARLKKLETPPPPQQKPAKHPRKGKPDVNALLLAHLTSMPETAKRALLDDLRNGAKASRPAAPVAVVVPPPPPALPPPPPPEPPPPLALSTNSLPAVLASLVTAQQLAEVSNAIVADAKNETGKTPPGLVIEARRYLAKAVEAFHVDKDLVAALCARSPADRVAWLTEQTMGRAASGDADSALVALQAEKLAAEITSKAGMGDGAAGWDSVIPLAPGVTLNGVQVNYSVLPGQPPLEFQAPPPRFQAPPPPTPGET